MKLVTEITPLIPLTCYFLAIAIAHSLLPPAATAIPKPKSARHALFVIAAGSSLGITWFYMLAFLKRSFTEFYHPLSPDVSLKTISYWLRETHLFEQAWRTVCSTPARWWVSSQICTYATGIWTVFLWKEGILPSLFSAGTDLV